MKKVIIEAYISEALYFIMESGATFRMQDGTLNGTPVFVITADTPGHCKEEVMSVMLESESQKIGGKTRIPGNETNIADYDEG